MKPVLYRPGSKTPLAAAFTLAAAIHVSALAFAPTREPAAINPGTGVPDVEIFDPEPEPPEPEEPQPIEPAVPPPIDRPNEFAETPEPLPRLLPRAVKPLRVTRVAPVRQTTGNGMLFAINAPRPAYPYEARRDHITGSGIALLHVDPGTGSVLTGQIVQSTGSPLLDNSALAAFRRWRFRAGSPSQVKIPFTFTMYGAQL